MRSSLLEIGWGRSRFATRGGKNGRPKVAELRSGYLAKLLNPKRVERLLNRSEALWIVGSAAYQHLEQACVAAGLPIGKSRSGITGARGRLQGMEITEQDSQKVREGLLVRQKRLQCRVAACIALDSANF